MRTARIPFQKNFQKIIQKYNYKKIIIKKSKIYYKWKREKMYAIKIIKNKTLSFFFIMFYYFVTSIFQIYVYKIINYIIILRK